MKKAVLSKTLFSFACILALLVSCGGDDPQASAQTDAVTDMANETEAVTDSYVRDKLPDDLDFGGEIVTFYYRDEIANEFCATEVDGELVNDALYNSHLAVENRLNVDIETVLEPGHYMDARASYMNRITQSVAAGDDLYDWVDLMIGNSPGLALEGNFMNLADMPYIDFSQPWYLTDMLDEVAIDNRLYFISGDASLGYLKCTFCMFYNVDLAAQYDIGNLYEIVNEGKWTLDKLIELSKLVAQDLDNNSKYDTNDKLGFALHNNMDLNGFIGSCDIPTFSRDDDGAWQFDFGDERDIGVCDRLYSLMHETDGVFCNTQSTADTYENYDLISNSFLSGNALIITSEMDDITTALREMKYAYGILPYPKYNEEQAEYKSVARNTQNAFSMPITCSVPDAACAVMEALSCENYNTVFPAYFETTMKAKYSLDNETAQMFDLIRNSTSLSFWYTYNNSLGSATSIIYASTLNANKAGQVSSKVASNQKKIDKLLAAYIETVEGLEE